MNKSKEHSNGLDTEIQDPLQEPLNIGDVLLREMAMKEYARLIISIILSYI